MSIYLREARASDLEDILLLAKQFILLNLPAHKKSLEKIIALSKASFAQTVPKEEREYLFVAEDAEVKKVVAASKIVTKHGRPENPHVFYKVNKVEKFSSDLGLGFIHQTLQFKEDEDGPTELGGLIVDRDYRRRAEKVGKSISLVRFLYIAAHKALFEDRLHCELAPPLTDEGRSEFWEALGRRFTGLPYEEADRLSHTNKEFIKSLFPEDDIYLTLLESKARLVVGEVSEETKPAKALLESLGFKYKDEIDPFDGGPHFGVETAKAKPVQMFHSYKLGLKDKLKSGNKLFLVGGFVQKEFRAKILAAETREDQLLINKEFNKELQFEDSQEVYTIPIYY